MKRNVGRLGRVVNGMNAWLLVFAIGLGMLDLTVLVAKSMPSLPPLPASAQSDTAVSPNAPAPVTALASHD